MPEDRCSVKVAKCSQCSGATSAYVRAAGGIGGDTTEARFARILGDASALIGNIEGLRRDDPELRRQVRWLWRKLGGARRRRPAAEDDEEGEESGSSGAGSDEEDEDEGEGDEDDPTSHILLTTRLYVVNLFPCRLDMLNTITS